MHSLHRIFAKRVFAIYHRCRTGGFPGDSPRAHAPGRRALRNGEVCRGLGGIQDGADAAHPARIGAAGPVRASL